MTICPQVSSWVIEVEVQWAIWVLSGKTIRGPFVSYGEKLVEIGLLEVGADGLISHDGWLVRDVNDLLEKLGGVKGCWLSKRSVLIFVGDSHLCLLGPSRCGFLFVLIW